MGSQIQGKEAHSKVIECLEIYYADVIKQEFNMNINIKLETALHLSITYKDSCPLFDEELITL